MPFKKGQSGNPDGKPKGLNHKATVTLRETITNFLVENFDQIKRDSKKLSPRDRSRLYCDLLQYGVPRLQNVSAQVEKIEVPFMDLSHLSFEELKKLTGEETDQSESGKPK